jgi:protein-glutamine gamma-glutamyltransferase
MFSQEKNLELFFRIVSYSVAVIALLTLLASGSIGIVSSVFFLFIILLAWQLEGSRWQISEKFGVVLIILIIPLFYLDYYFGLSGFSSRDTFTAGNLSRLILVLSSIKLLQKKSDRDWAFVYIIAFFEILLAAGVGISPLFLACLLLYLLITFTAIILFEIRRSSNSVSEKREKLKIAQTQKVFSKKQLFRLPLTATFILIAISLIAVPLFFAFPRVGGAGFGSNLGGLSGFTGFSDSVKLGEIGKLQQNDEVVMRVRLKTDGNEVNSLRWRGITLDSFEGQTWRKTRNQNIENIAKTENNYFILDNENDTKKLITQTIYLEPIDTPVLFALARPIALQGNFDFVSKDADGSLTTIRRSFSRISYKAYSNNNLPGEDELKSDNLINPSSVNRYVQLPKGLDERIPQLTKQIISEAGAKSRFEQAKAVEQYLQNSFGYTLDLKAGGNDPLADFLFNVREGHCEYFASALAIMLRTQGIATRVVNGFNGGEYNETADVYVVRQKNAHSWVEVYFPKTKTWVPFDATPAAGQTLGQEESAGFTSRLSKTIEALETFWIQYVVSYDNNEQRSLFMSIRNGLSDFQDKLGVWFYLAQEKFWAWWQDVKGEKGLGASLWAIGSAIVYLIGTILGIFALILLWRKLKTLELWKRIRLSLQRRKETSVVEFYQRMQKVLAKQGFIRQPHQTPLEFAFALDMPQAVKITEKYNEVRFGEKNLSTDEAREIDDWLKGLEVKK